ncbi:zinc finger protein 85 [Biomphalaria glabrata]
MDDLKQNMNECKNGIKIEKIDWSDTPENSFAGQTYELTLAEEAQGSEEQSHSRSMLDDMKQDFTNDLKNVLKIEKKESSLHSETHKMSSSLPTFEEETQKQMVNWNEEMTLMQDMYARNTPNKDGYTENSKNEAHNFSYNNRNQQLVNTEKKFDQFHISTETFSASSKICNDEIYLERSHSVISLKMP